MPIGPCDATTTKVTTAATKADARGNTPSVARSYCVSGLPTSTIVEASRGRSSTSIARTRLISMFLRPAGHAAERTAATGKWCVRKRADWSQATSMARECTGTKDDPHSSFENYIARVRPAPSHVCSNARHYLYALANPAEWQ